MAQLISDKEFLRKNLYQVMARGMQYEALDANKTGVKALSNMQSNLTKEPPFQEVITCYNNKRNAFFTSQNCFENREK